MVTLLIFSAFYMEAYFVSLLFFMWGFTAIDIL